LLPARVPQV